MHTRAERRADTVPSLILAFESRTVEKMTSKNVCTCWKKNVGMDSASSRSTSTWNHSITDSSSNQSASAKTASNHDIDHLLTKLVTWPFCLNTFILHISCFESSIASDWSITYDNCTIQNKIVIKIWGNLRLRASCLHSSLRRAIRKLFSLQIRRIRRWNCPTPATQISPISRYIQTNKNGATDRWNSEELC